MESEVMAKEKSYSFDEYLDTFSPNTCKPCTGSGVVGSLPLRTLRHCPDCNGTGRKDRHTLKDLARDAVKAIRPAAPTERGEG